MLRWTPTFIFGPAEALETLTLELPVGLWNHAVPTVGTARKTRTGTPGVTLQQTQHLLRVPVRFYEHEWPAVRRLVEWGQTKAPFVWIPESDPLAADQLEQAIVTMVAPRITEPIEPEPDGEYPRALTLVLTFRQIQEGNES